ncbi:MAG: helix-hairpin-helix domain-containing protein [Fimbriimonadales bacterium]|nr:helix-hairpin-helix domain-containing protein [Fimbriimonadales bacterium]
MQSLWDKLEGKERLWLGAVYGISLLLTFLVAYNLGRGSKVDLKGAPGLRREGAGVSASDSARPAAGRGAETPSNPDAPVQEIDLSAAGTTTFVTVHVAGQVNKPGVYTLPPNSRLRDALQRAGGAKPAADLDGVNLAERLSDGQKIYVPHKAETHIATAESEPRLAGGTTRTPSKSPPRFPVDLNRATAEELEALPGIGPVLAARIVEYRQMRGRFQSVDELLEVRGIGPKRLEQLRPYVVVR